MAFCTADIVCISVLKLMKNRQSQPKTVYLSNSRVSFDLSTVITIHSAAGFEVYKGRETESWFMRGNINTILLLNDGQLSNMEGLICIGLTQRDS